MILFKLLVRVAIPLGIRKEIRPRHGVQRVQQREKIAWAIGDRRAGQENLTTRGDVRDILAAENLLRALGVTVFASVRFIKDNRIPLA